MFVDEEGIAAQRFGVEAFPTFVLLDTHGVVRFIHVGSYDHLDALLTRIRKWPES